MKFSEAWLREWVNPALGREDLLQQLTMAGLEVDGVEPVAGRFSGVVVAIVEGCERHANAEKLSVCTVFDGEVHSQVVCGAPNVRVGLRVAFARVGARLPGDFKIKKAKLRGVASEGMLCSAKELGLGDNHDGIMELPQDWSAGTDLIQAMQLDDVTVDVDLTPNRGDCLSIRGIAREVGVLNNLAVTEPPGKSVEAASDATFPVHLAAPDACPRYLGRVIRGIDVSRPTPYWMQERLRRCGLRSIDAVVDVTNFVLVELGQPMHAFDLNQLSEGIVVRKALEGEELTLLDGQQVNLDTETLLITDAQGPIAIAGVMGGARSGVQADTQDVFLESAFFAQLAVAGTARRYGLHTDASHRYERGVDFQLQAQAMARATQLLVEIVGGTPGPVVERSSQEHLPQPRPICLRQHRLQALLGVDIAAEQVDQAFVRLGFAVVERSVHDSGVSWQIVAPSHRFDIALEADLVEEICRIYGYNNIPSRQPLAEVALKEVSLEAHSEAALKGHLAGQGFQEVITYSFIDPQLQHWVDPGQAPIKLANPMSSEQSVMRTNLLAGLIDTLRANRARQQDSVKLFELGLTFVPQADQLIQAAMLGGLIWGRRSRETWHGASGLVDFYDAKGVVEGLLSWAGATGVSFAPCEDPILHPGQSASVMLDDRNCGRVGRLHPQLESQLGVDGIFVFEIVAQAAIHRPHRVYAGLSRFPSVRRDLAVVVDQEVSAAAVEKVVRHALGEVLVEFRLFDVYVGKGIDSNEKSLALGLTLQSRDATLTEDTIGLHTEAAVDALRDAFSARLR